MFWFSGSKKEVKKLKEEIHGSFSNVKKDFNKVGEWIRHIDGKHSNHEDDISMIKDQLIAIQGDLDEIKEFISFFGEGISKQLPKQTQTAVYQQQVVEAVQMPVQTAVQTDFLSNLTVMERAIVWALLNSELKLSYEDLAHLMGKDKSTIRGQINTIKQKCSGLIEETQERTGKKRLSIPDKMRENILKSVKVRVRDNKKNKKDEKND
ncbi:MAG: hypothetical protein WCP89_00870 [archaeon]